jgi:hypothetical protein
MSPKYAPALIVATATRLGACVAVRGSDTDNRIASHEPGSVLVMAALPPARQRFGSLHVRALRGSTRPWADSGPKETP